MQIRVLKNITAAACPLGISSKEYKAGESYEIFNNLAEVFLTEGWGELEQKMFAPKLENKAIKSAPENKSFEPVFENVSEEILIEETISEEVVIVEPKKRAKSKK